MTMLANDLTVRLKCLPQDCRKALAELARQGRSRHTARSYDAAQRYWGAWFEAVFGHPFSLPVSIDTVLVFIAQHAVRASGAHLVQAMTPQLDAALVHAGVKARPGPLGLNTVLHRIAVLSAAHRDQDLPNPCRDPVVRQVLRDLRSAYAKRGDRPRKKDALDALDVGAMLRTCDTSLRGMRDRALLLFAWSTGGQRRSEVADARMENLLPGTDGDFIYDLTHGKTNPFGEDWPENRKPVVGAAAQALREWIDAAHIDSGPIFRSIRGHRQIGASLSGDAVNDIVQKRSWLASLQGNLSAHSLRSGFMTQALAAGVGLPEAMALSGHRSARTALSYTRVDPAAMRRAAGNLTRRASSAADAPPTCDDNFPDLQTLRWKTND
jgi:integrase